MNSGTAATLVGVWGSGPDDVWAVGGDNLRIHYDGTQWSQYYEPELSFPDLRDFKDIHGTAADNIFAVGDDGVILHYPRPPTLPGGWFTPACCATGMGNALPVLLIPFLTRLLPRYRRPQILRRRGPA